MDFVQINKILCEKCSVKEEKIVNQTINVKDLTFIKLRDTLIILGRIDFEDLENKVYIARIKGGIAKKNTAIVAIAWGENALQISAFAQEGLINQHTVEGVIDEIKLAVK